jgi:hypothetical protein
MVNPENNFQVVCIVIGTGAPRTEREREHRCGNVQLARRSPSGSTRVADLGTVREGSSCRRIWIVARNAGNIAG